MFIFLGILLIVKCIHRINNQCLNSVDSLGDTEPQRVDTIRVGVQIVWQVNLNLVTPELKLLTKIGNWDQVLIFHNQVLLLADAEAGVFVRIRD